MSIDALHTEYNPRTDDNFEGITSVDENVSVDNSVVLEESHIHTIRKAFALKIDSIVDSFSTVLDATGQLVSGIRKHTTTLASVGVIGAVIGTAILNPKQIDVSKESDISTMNIGSGEISIDSQYVLGNHSIHIVNDISNNYAGFVEPFDVHSKKPIIVRLNPIAIHEDSIKLGISENDYKNAIIANEFGSIVQILDNSNETTIPREVLEAAGEYAMYSQLLWDMNNSDQVVTEHSQVQVFRTLVGSTSEWVKSNGVDKYSLIADYASLYSFDNLDDIHFYVDGFADYVYHETGYDIFPVATTVGSMLASKETVDLNPQLASL